MVRKHKYIPEDDPRYSSGCDMENRIEPPPVEIPGDAFDRQRCLFDFNQRLLEQQNCLVLGAGGIGQNVGLVLARVGVRNIVFIDKDNYETSNLTRQLLGSVKDIGRKKVDVAADCINKFHNLSSTHAEGYNYDALERWDEIIKCARSSKVLFNCIDVGTVFDFAVNSLSKALSIPLVQGQSAGWSVNAEFFTGQPGLLCGSCNSGIASSYALKGSSFKEISSRLYTWIIINANCTVADVPLSTTAVKNDTNWNERERKCIDSYELSSGNLLSFLKQDKQYRVDGPTTKDIVINAVRYVNSFGLGKNLEISGVDTIKEESIYFKDFQLFLENYYSQSLELLLPDKICSLKDILFIPQPKSIPTRYIGSWVCPCLTVSTIMVSQWVNYLTGPTFKDPPSSFQLSLANCRTDICDTALECGFVDTPSQSSDPSSAQCLTCSNVVWKIEEQLFYSFVPVTLNTVKGKVGKWKERTDEAKGPQEPLNDKNLNINTINKNSEESISGIDIGPHIELRKGVLWYNIDYLGKDYSNLAIDAVPMKVRVGGSDGEIMSDHDLFSEHSSDQKDADDSGYDRWPEALKSPLVKEEHDSNAGSTLAYGSGQRSALLCDGDGQSSEGKGKVERWFRLKGCGMPDRGFTVEDALDDNGEPIQISITHNETSDTDINDMRLLNIRKIRGAAYSHTCAIELRMTARIDELLRPKGMCTANRPLGKWSYDSINFPFPLSLEDSSQDNETLRNPVEMEYPLVTRSCALFETLGDRRLSDHVLRGLEILLSLVATPSPTVNGSETIKRPLSRTSTSTSVLRALEVEIDDTNEEYLNIEGWDEYDSRLTHTKLLFNGGSKSPPHVFTDLLHPSSPLKGIAVWIYMYICIFFYIYCFL